MASRHAQIRERLEQARETVRRRKAERDDWALQVRAAVAADSDSIERLQRGFERATKSLSAAQSHEDGLLRRYADFLLSEGPSQPGQRAENPLPLTGQYRTDPATGRQFKRTQVKTEDGVKHYDVTEGVAERYLADAEQWRRKWKQTDTELRKLRAEARAEKKKATPKKKAAPKPRGKAAAKAKTTPKAKVHKETTKSTADSTDVNARLYKRPPKRSGGVTVNAKWKGEARKLWMDVRATTVGKLVVHPRLLKLSADGTRARVHTRTIVVTVRPTGQTFSRKFTSVAAAKAAIAAANKAHGVPKWSAAPTLEQWHEVFQAHSVKSKPTKPKAVPRRTARKTRPVVVKKATPPPPRKDPDAGSDDDQAKQAMAQLEMLLSKPGILEQAEALGRAELAKKKKRGTS